MPQTIDKSQEHLTYSLDRLTFWLVTIAVIRLAGLLLIDLPLFGDEAQYWSWAKNLDFGYYSKPPMLAWGIALTTGLFGDAEWALRLPTLIFHTGTALGVWCLASALADRRTAFYSAILFATLPSVWLSAMIASTDPPLLCFWAFGLFFLYRARQSRRSLHWVLFGLFVGLGMLSKFATIYLLMGLVLWLLIDRDVRGAVQVKQVAMALVVAFLVFLPNLLWNAAHEFVSWIHLGENANLGGELFRPEKALEFQASQLGVFGPILYAVLLYLVITAKKRWHDPVFRFLFCFVAPAMLVIGVQAFLSRANANWQAPVFVAGSIMVARHFLSLGRPVWLKSSIGLHSVIGISIIVLAYMSSVGGWPFPGKDPFGRLKGWDEMGRQVSIYADDNPGRALLFSHRMTLAEMLYYAPDVAQPLLKWNPDPWINDQYELTTSLLNRRGENMLLITRDPEPKDVLSRFDSATSLGVIDIPTSEGRRLWYEVWAVDGFNGYEFEFQ